MAAKYEKMTTAGKDDRTFPVLVAVDGSPKAYEAFIWYMDNCYNDNHRVIIALGIQAPIVYGVTTQYAYAGLTDELKKVSYEIQKPYAKVLKKRNIKGSFIASMEKSPELWLSEVSETENVQLIILGARGQGTLRKTILGSVTDYLLHHASCAVAVRP